MRKDFEALRVAIKVNVPWGRRSLFVQAELDIDGFHVY